MHCREGNGKRESEAINMMTQHPCRCDEPTCHDCNHYGYEECPYYPNEATLEGSACIRHPQAREYLMADVIKELEWARAAKTTELIDEHIDNAIALIKGGKA